MLKFSVIVPVYNVEKYLHKCVDSILSQTFKNFECILVDDGSPDNCPRICDDYAKKDSRIKVIHKENGGLSSARNAGLDVAQGEYICFVDSDDYIAENLLKKVGSKFEETQSDMIVFNYNCVGENAEFFWYTRFEVDEYEINSNKERFDFILEKVLRSKINWESWNRVYKKKIIDKNQIRFVDNRRIFAEDLYFTMCYLLHAKKISVIEDKLYNYMSRPDSIMGQNKKIKVQKFVHLNKEIYCYIKEKQNKYFLKNYYRMFYLIMENETRNYSLESILNEILKMEKSLFFRRNLLKVIFKTKRVCCKNLISGERKKYIRYLIYSYKGIGGKLLRGGLHQIKKLYNALKNCLYAIKKVLKRIPNKIWKKNIYLLGTEDFGNLGDHMIAITEIEFLKQYYPKYNIIELPSSCYWKQIKEYQKNVKRRDRIFLHGGGNMGDLYPTADLIKTDAISRFPKNRILIFPQTIFFDDLESNKDRTMLDYAKAKRLTIATREKYSYQLGKDLYKNANIILTPDIVLYNNLQCEGKRTSIIRLCLRRDTERTLADEENDILLKSLSSYKIERFDMQLAYSVSVDERDKYIEDILQQYRTARLIITDRLHGMIFSAITGTPCIVLDSKSYKLKGCYEWIKNLSYIKFAEDVHQVANLIEEISKIKEICYTNGHLIKEFEQIIQAMK